MFEYLGGIYDKTIAWFEYALQYIAGLFSGLLSSIAYYLIKAFHAVTNPLFNKLSGLVDSLGIAGRVAELSNLMTGNLAFFLDFFRVPQGLTTLIAAYAIRFLIRRLPFIG